MNVKNSFCDLSLKQNQKRNYRRKDRQSSSLNTSFFFVLAFVLVLGISNNASAQGTSKCPEINVTGPAGLTYPGDPTTFLLTIKDLDPKLKVTYKWTSNGEIIDGQGTTKIKVLSNGDGTHLTSTVEVDGLPVGCPSMASEIVQGDPSPEAELLFEFSERLSTQVATKIKEKVATLSPYVQFYVLLPGSKDLHSDETGDTLSVLRSIFKERGTFVFTDKKDYPVTIYAVPPGASNPQP